MSHNNDLEQFADRPFSLVFLSVIYLKMWLFLPAHLRAEVGVAAAHAPPGRYNLLRGAQLLRAAQVPVHIVLCGNNIPLTPGTGATGRCAPQRKHAMGPGKKPNNCIWQSAGISVQVYIVQ